MIIQNSGLPGDLKEFTVRIDGKDISQFVTACTIYMDILAPAWTCNVSIEDHNNLIMNLPIRQGEKIEIKVETGLDSELDGEKTFEFVVGNITDRAFINTMHQTYSIVGVTEASIKNSGTRISQAFTNMSPTAIVSKIVSEHIKDTTVETHDATNTVTTIIPNISPYNAIAQMCRVAVIQDRADFVFFQSDNKKYSLKSIGKIYESEDSGFTFIMRPSSLRDSSGNLKYDYCMAFTEYQISHYNSTVNKASGYYANKVVQFDLLTQNWSEKTFKFGDDVSEDAAKKSWDKDSLFEQDDSSVTFIPRHAGMGEGDTILDSSTTWHGSRKSSLLKLEQENVVIQLPCGVKVWESIGKTCKLDLPSQQDHTDETYDKQMKGKYIIGAIALWLGKHAAFTNLQLIKLRHEQKL